MPAHPFRTRIVTAAIGIAVVVIGGVILHRSAFDLAVVQWLNAGHVGLAATLANLVYHSVEPVPAIIGTVVITAVIVAVRRDLALASAFAVTIAVTWLSSAAVKILVDRPRPELSLLSHPPTAQPDGSYPSGHTAFIVALAVTAILLTRSVALRRVWVVVGIVAAAGIMLCVLSDGLHFPTDVLASAVWSISIAPLVCALWQRIVIPRVPLFRPRRVAS